MKRHLRSALASVALGFCALVAGPAFSTEYYVDSMAGADANDGTSVETPWKTIDRVNRADLKPGDSVLFCRSRVWRETLRAKSGEEGNPITYGAYGDGVAPRIMSSADLSDPELWTRVGDDLWATPECSFVDAKAPAPETARFAAGRWTVYTEEAAKGSCEGTTFADLDGAKGWRVKCSNSGEKTTFFQLTNQSFPVRRDRLVALRFHARSSVPFTIPANCPTLMMSGKPWSSYGNVVSPNLEVETEWREFDVIFHTTADADDGRVTFFLGSIVPEGAQFDFVVDGARELETTTVDLGADVGNLVFTEHGVVEQSASPALKRFAPTYDKREYAGFKKWTLDDVKANGDFWYDIANRRVFLKLDENPGEKYASIEAVLRPHCCQCPGHDVVIENIAFTHTGAHGISSPKSKRVTIRDCFFDWIGGGDLGGGGGDGERVRFGNGIEFWDGSVDSTIERCVFSRVYDVATTTQGASKDVSRNLTIRDCVMYRCEQAFEIWFTNAETVLEGCVFERNLCVDCGRDWSHVQRPNKIATPILGYNLTCKTVDVTIRDNVFCDSSEYFVKVWHDRIGEYHIDNNVYWVWPDKEHFQGEKYFGYRDGDKHVLYTYDEYREKTGQDKNSRWLEPKFRDYEKDDFELLNRDELNAGPLPK